MVERERLEMYISSPDAKKGISETFSSFMIAVEENK